MANYRAHSLINLFIALPPLAAVALFAVGVPKELVVTGGLAFIYGTLFMSPDVDLAYQIKLFSLRGLLSLPFYTYSMIFRHRGLSHNLLFGTATRVIWLTLFAGAVFIVIYNVFPQQETLLTFLQDRQRFLIASYAGLFLADACHIGVDKFA
ncbi:MAG: DUF2227 family putative metal-binding protein [Verrucomicrobia bacterium]|nr:DUF2227 family putative metal-binding protein [Verrucomicrobiota bacterium]